MSSVVFKSVDSKSVAKLPNDIAFEAAFLRESKCHLIACNSDISQESVADGVRVWTFGAGFIHQQSWHFLKQF
jgi:hypothetical protein